MTEDSPQNHRRTTSGAESGNWCKVDGATATIHALDGHLGFAALPSTRLKAAHGHIASIYPVARQPSGSLGIDVPIVANIGKNDWVGGKPNPPVKASEAFPVKLGEPDYFVYLA